MIAIQISEDADWALFEKIADTLQIEFGGIWTQKLDGFDQRYWDLMIDGQRLTLHLEHYLGVSVMIQEGSELFAHRIRRLLQLD
jgi:hypothetical protein